MKKTKQTKKGGKKRKGKTKQKPKKIPTKQANDKKPTKKTPKKTTTKAPQIFACEDTRNISLRLLFIDFLSMLF